MLVGGESGLAAGAHHYHQAFPTAVRRHTARRGAHGGAGCACGSVFGMHRNFCFVPVDGRNTTHTHTDAHASMLRHA